MTIHYMGLGEFADRIGLSRNTINTYGRNRKLPPPNAMIGDIRGWLPDTIDEWNSRRPGKRPRGNEHWYVMQHSTIHYLGVGEFADRLNLSRSTVNGYGHNGKLPLCDAEIGDVRGWLPVTVDEWNSRRPGQRPTRAREDWYLPPELQQR